MNYRSVLFDSPGTTSVVVSSKEPECFKDLNLDQIVAAITAGRDEYDLKPFFHTPLRDIGAIYYRQEIMRDLESRELSGRLGSFAKRMRNVREQLAQLGKLSYAYQKQRCFLDAADAYCDAVEEIAHDLTAANIRSRGLRMFREYLSSYASGEEFSVLTAETKQQRADLTSLSYCLLIEANRVTVSRYSGEVDYNAEVLQTFGKFKESQSAEYKFSLV